MGAPDPRPNDDCSSPYHEEHLCVLMYQGVHLEDGDTYRALIREPQCRCRRCARTAHAARNLCEPVDL